MNIRALQTEEDMLQVREIVHGMLGEVCWEARLGYVNTLYLHFGERLEYGHGQRKTYYGSWFLGSCGSMWKVEFGDVSKPLTSEDDQSRIMTELWRASGGSVRTVEIDFDSLSLEVTFDNGVMVEIEGIVEDDFDSPYWELFTPEEKILTIGPGKQWSYTSAIREKKKRPVKRRFPRK